MANGNAEPFAVCFIQGTERIQQAVNIYVLTPKLYLHDGKTGLAMCGLMIKKLHLNCNAT